jgi:hypothetical protein
VGETKEVLSGKCPFKKKSICQTFFIVIRKEGNNLHIYHDNGKFSMFFHQYKTIAWDSYYASSD